MWHNKHDLQNRPKLSESALNYRNQLKLLYEMNFKSLEIKILKYISICIITDDYPVIGTKLCKSEFMSQKETSDIYM